LVLLRRSISKSRNVNFVLSRRSISKLRNVSFITPGHKYRTLHSRSIHYSSVRLFGSNTLRSIRFANFHLFDQNILKVDSFYFKANFFYTIPLCKISVKIFNSVSILEQEWLNQPILFQGPYCKIWGIKITTLYICDLLFDPSNCVIVIYIFFVVIIYIEIQVPIFNLFISDFAY